MQSTIRKGWFIWLIASIFILYQFFLQTSTSVVLPQLGQEYNISTTQMGILSSTFYYTYLTFQLPAGILIDKYGARRILSLTFLGCAIAAILFGVAKTIHTLEVSRLLMGLMAATSVAGVLTLAGNWLPNKQFALAVALTEALGMLGAIAGEHGLAIAITLFQSWRIPMLLLGIIGIALSGLLWLVIRDRPPYLYNQSENQESPISLRALFSLLSSPQIWLVGLTCGLTFSLLPAFASLWGVPFLRQSFDGLSVQDAAFTSSLILWGTAIGAPIIAWLSELIERRRPLIFFGSATTAILLLFIFAGEYIGINLNLKQMQILFFLLGISTSIYILLFALTQEIAPSKTHGSNMGYINTMCVIIGAALQPVIGWLIGVHHHQGRYHETYDLPDYQFALLTLPICYLLACILLLFIRETYCQNHSWD